VRSAAPNPQSDQGYSCSKPSKAPRVVLRANPEFVLPIVMMVSDVAEQRILPLRFFVAIKVSPQKHWGEGIAVVVVVDAERCIPAP